MNKIRKYLCISLLLLLSLVMIGCHGTYQPIDPINDYTNKGYFDFVVPTKFDASKNYEISFWSKNDSNITQKAIYNQAIEDFQKIYPNIKVTIKSYTDYTLIYNDVITNIGTKTTPNVCISYPDHVATYLDGDKIVVPLDNLINDKNYGLGGKEVQFESTKKEEMISSFFKESKFWGHYYTMPFMRSTEACYVNVDYVKRLGFSLPEVLTWDFVWEVCEKAMSEKKDDQILIPFIYKSTDNMMIQMLRQKGYPYSTDNGDILIFNNQTKEILNSIASHMPNRCFSTFSISSYPGNFYNAEQCIFAIDSTAGATWIGSDAPLIEIPKEDVRKFETRVMMIPQYNPSTPTMISQGPSICIFNKNDPQEVLASWLFVQYLLTNDVQIAYAQTEGYVPVTKKAQESKDYIDYLNNKGKLVKGDNSLYYQVKIDASLLLLNNLDNTFVTPVFNNSASLRNASGQLIEETVKACRRKDTINDYFYDNLFDKMKQLYRLYPKQGKK